MSEARGRPSGAQQKRAVGALTPYFVHCFLQVEVLLVPPRKPVGVGQVLLLHWLPLPVHAFRVTSLFYYPPVRSLVRASISLSDLSTCVSSISVARLPSRLSVSLRSPCDGGAFWEVLASASPSFHSSAYWRIFKFFLCRFGLAVFLLIGLSLYPFPVVFVVCVFLLLVFVCVFSLSCLCRVGLFPSACVCLSLSLHVCLSACLSLYVCLLSCWLAG